MEKKSMDVQKPLDVPLVSIEKEGVLLEAKKLDRRRWLVILVIAALLILSFLIVLLTFHYSNLPSVPLGNVTLDVDVPVKPQNNDTSTLVSQKNETNDTTAKKIKRGGSSGGGGGGSSFSPCSPSFTCQHYYDLKQCGYSLNDGCFDSLNCSVCNTGFYCNQTLSCVALPSCTSDVNCSSLNGACRKGLCNVTLGNCYVNYSTERSNCSNGICHNGNCVECILNSDCLDEETCIQGTCFDSTETFSFMWIGDDNVGSASTAVRFAYTEYPDLEVIFHIRDLGGDRASNYNQLATEWHKNPNSNPSFTPLFMGLGNHDAEVMATVNYTSEFLGPNLTKSLPGMKNFNEGPYVTYPNGYSDRNLTYSFDYKNAHFIMWNIYSQDSFLNQSLLNGACGLGSGNVTVNRFNTTAVYSPIGYISPEIMSWLEEDLNYTNATFKFMFYHEGAQPVPGGRHTGDSLDCLYLPGNWVERSWMNDTRPPMREKFWSMLAKYNVTANFVGHAHHNTLTWANDLYGGNGAVYEIESGIPPNLAVVSIRGENATLHLYDAVYDGIRYNQFEPFGEIMLSEDNVNHAPKIYQHYAGIESGFYVMSKTSYLLEIDQVISGHNGLWFEAKDSDVDDRINFSFSGLPSFLAVNAPVSTFKFDEIYRRVLLTTNTSSSNKLLVSNIGNYSFDIIASDGQGQDMINVNISVVPANNPVALGASIPNNSVINFPMYRGIIQFFCYDEESGPAILRYNGYSVKRDGVSVSCCSAWHSYGYKSLNDNLALSEFLFPDDYDGIKDVIPGRYDITFFCNDAAGHRSNNYSLTMYLSNNTTESVTYGSWPTNGSKVNELDRISFWTTISTSNLNTLKSLIIVKRNGYIFSDYHLLTSQYNSSLSYGVFDIKFNAPAQNGTYHININGTLFEFVVGNGSYVPPAIDDSVIYVDNTLSFDCNNYYPPTRTCGSGDKISYNSLSDVTPIALAGDTIEIRGGYYNEIFKPINSGNSTDKIIYRRYNNESVIISGVATDTRLATHPDDPNYNYGPIWLEYVNYTIIDGINFSSVEGFGRITRSYNNVFRKCNFHGPTNDWIIGLNLFESNFNNFENNLFEGASDNFRMIHSEKNVIENNRFYNGRHVLLTLKCSSNNVIRKNYLYNQIQKAMEVLDCEQPTMFDHYNIYYQDASIKDSAKYNLIENNTFAYTATDRLTEGYPDGPFSGIQYSAQKGIIRKNFFYDNNGGAIGMGNYVEEAEYTYGNRVYSNVFYKNRFAGIGVGGSTTFDFYDNIFKNNILYKNDFVNWNGVYNLWGWANANGKPLQIWTKNSGHGYLFYNNNLLNQSAGENHVIAHADDYETGDPANRSLAWWQANYPSLYKNNLQVNPMFVNENIHDFRLRSTSLLINAGAFLTNTTSSGNGNVIVVSDAKYFYDGFGITGEVGDLIQLEGQTITARILDVNYDTNTLTLDTSLTWNSGQGLSLVYSGNKPDIGAYEYTGGIGGTSDDFDDSAESTEEELHSENAIGTILNWFRGLLTGNTIKAITGYFLKIR